MLVFRSARFDEAVERHKIGAKMAEFCSQLADVSTYPELLGLMDPFPPFLKRREGKLRIMGEVRRVDGRQILCLLDIFARKDSEYGRFMGDPRGFGRDRLASLCSDADLTALIEKADAEPDADLKYAPPALPEDLLPWLEPPAWAGQDDDLLICETEEWLQRFRRREIGDYWETYQRIIVHLCDEIMTGQIAPSDASLRQDAGRFVQYRVFDVTREQERPSRVLLLIAPFTTDPSEAELNDVLQRSNLPEGHSPRSVDEVSAYARRAYPSFIAFSSDAWLAIEREDEANLALSAEEEAVLTSVAGHSDRAGLPVFVNGRAGSGKSTMLAYLFASFCHRKLATKLPGSPLYLTVNTELLKNARASVQRLLESGHRYVADADAQQMSSADLETFFRPFQQFLLDLLPQEERERFTPDRYISFLRFKRLYSRRAALGDADLQPRLPELKKWPAESAWYVIRAFIKGYFEDRYMDGDDYEEVPRRERTVDDSVFREITDSIWEKWYRPLTEERGYWDDQDLVRRVLAVGRTGDGYTAIFCDEAQDLTRIELRFVMKLSLLARYSLGYSTHCLPFAFAGDPFQTLNPTGFRWSSVQSAFYGEIIRSLDPSGGLGLSMNFQQLDYNYRSSPNIVRASNVIQLWRHVLFRIEELRPQLWWGKGAFSPARRFVVGRDISTGELTDYLADAIIIVPCEEGEEWDFVDEDDVLAPALSGQDRSQPPKNVLSAISAKGLEFKRVVLYKWGANTDSSIWTLLDDTDTRNTLAHQYFFNKLYVAASRAMEHLFIIDTPEGDDYLWARAASWDALNDVLGQAEDVDEWRERIEPVAIGSSEDTAEIKETDLRSIADEFRAKGLSSRNIEYLRRARGYYNLIGAESDGELCEAWALRFEGDHGKAGQKFVALGHPTEAQQTWWDGLCWGHLADALQPKGEVGNPTVRRIATFMAAESSDAEPLSAFVEFVESMPDLSDLLSQAPRQWRLAMNELANRADSFDNDALAPTTWEAVGRTLERFAGLANTGAFDSAARAFYKAGNHSAAAANWERCGQTRGEDYLRARAEISTSLERAEWLSRIPDDDALVEDWDQAGQPTGIRWSRLVAPALSRLGRHVEAFSAFLALDEISSARDAFEKASPTDVNVTHLETLVDQMLRKGLWADAFDLVDHRLANTSSPDQLFGVQCRLISELAHTGPRTSAGPALRKYENFVQKALAGEAWKNLLPVQEAGAALERLGGYVSALQFYERFINSEDQPVAQFAQTRWVAVKRRQIAHYEAQGNKSETDRSRMQLSRLARRWTAFGQPTLPEYPELPARPGVVAGLKGLPQGAKVESAGEASIRVVLPGLELQVDRVRKLILLVERESYTTARIDFVDARATGVDHTVLTGDEIEFALPAAGCICRAFTAQTPYRLELSWSSIAEPLIVEV